MSGASAGSRLASFSVPVASGWTRADSSAIAPPVGLRDPGSRWVAVTWRSSSPSAASLEAVHSRDPTAGGHLQVAGSQRVGAGVTRLVLQPLADGQVSDDWYAQGGQLIGRADAGAQQDGGAAVGAAGQDHFAGPVDGAVRGEDAGRGRAVKEHAVDVDITADGEAGPPAYLGGEIDQPCVLPDPVERVPVGVVLPDAVEVVHPLEPLRDRRVDESPQRRRQLGVRALPDRQRAGPPVVGVVAGGGCSPAA
jgi:hypothetical protein